MGTKVKKEEEQKTSEQELEALRREAEGLREQVASLIEQCEFPLTGHEVQMLHDVLAEVKTKLGERASTIAGLDLLDKLNRYLNPGLFDKAAEKTEGEPAV